MVCNGKTKPKPKKVYWNIFLGDMFFINLISIIASIYYVLYVHVYIALKKVSKYEEGKI